MVRIWVQIASKQSCTGFTVDCVGDMSYFTFDNLLDLLSSSKVNVHKQDVGTLLGKEKGRFKTDATVKDNYNQHFPL